MVLAVVVVGLVAAQFWRVLGIEAKAREVEVERARIAAEQLLRDAVGDPAVFALLPAEQRVELHPIGGAMQPVVEPEVGWIEADRDTQLDLIVADRLDRAARAEFVDRDAAAAAKAYDELLAGSLRAVDRLAVLSAAMWQAQRAGADARRDQLLQQAIDRIGELPPAASGIGFVANAIAGAVRLRAVSGGAAPAWCDRVVPRLPRPAARACLELPGGAALQPRLARTCARRELLALVQHRAAAVRGDAAGLSAAGGNTLLWWQPRDAGLVATVIDVGDWFQLLRRAGDSGAAAPWPWLLEPELGEAPVPAIAGIPHLAGFRAAARPLLEQGALLPIATVVLLLAFALLLTQQFRAARRETAAVQKQSDFLTTVTHELKTPLASIRLLSELLADGRARGKESEYYGLLAVEAGRLGMLIENVLDLGRAERGERAFELRSLDLGDLVRETLRMFAPLCERDGLRVALHDDTAGATVRGDRAALVQALLNVLDNARKYAAAGETLDVTVENGTPAQLSVRIRDHGPGVPIGEREAIFARFARGQAQQHGSIAGVGIGLYLARSIARRHGGDLLCQSPRTGSGAEFVLTLPQEPS